jgi:ACT domain-containing protein
METTNVKSVIISVVGTDQVGIIAKVSGFLSERGINILDISQTVLSGKFVMMMSVDLSSAIINLVELKNELNSLAEKEGLSISAILEDVFSAMHRI